MASIRWGSDTGGTTNVTFNGNVTLDNIRIIGSGEDDDDLALDWVRPTIDEDTLHYYPFDDSAANPTDQVGSSDWTDLYDSSYTTTDPFIGAAHLDTTGNGYGDVTLDDNFTLSSGYAVEAWVKTTRDTSERTILFSFGSFSLFLRVNQSSVPGVVRAAIMTVADVSSGDVWVSDTWTHVAMSLSSSSFRLYINGSEEASTETLPEDSWFYLGRMCMFRNRTNLTRFLNGQIDELAFHRTDRFPSEFTPIRYDTGNVVISHASASEKKPTSISWDATAGELYGKIHQVYVNSSSGWTQVGGDDPTSPISVSGITIPDEDAIKLVMSPKSDATQSETPILDWVQMDYDDGSANKIVMSGWI